MNQALKNPQHEPEENAIPEKYKTARLSEYIPVWDNVETRVMENTCRSATLKNSLAVKAASL